MQDSSNPMGHPPNIGAEDCHRRTISQEMKQITRPARPVRERKRGARSKDA
jgi:hypothetical protein